VHSLTQAAAFGRAGATAIQVYVGRTQAWYRNHPVHQLSNGLHGSDNHQGVEFVRHVKTTFTNESLDTKIIASSINDRENARALAGVDYMLLSDRVVRTLNDADARDEIDEIGAGVAARGGDVPTVGEVTRESFEAALRSSPAFEEINAHLELLHKDEEALKAFVKTSVMRND
jgi:transaldolase